MSHTTRTVLSSLLLLLATAARAAFDDDGRVSDGITPLRYRLELRVDPSRPGFDGDVRIAVRLATPTAEVRLHAKDLEIRHVEVLHDGHAVPGTAELGAASGLLLTFPESLAVGEHELHLAFAGRFADGLNGLYRAHVGGADYAFTQFEPLSARKAFPCFDEPRFKTPWEVTLRVPHGLVAAANAPVASTRTEAGADVVRFAPTRPLPTYLVAIAVGPFDVVKGAAGTPPLRVLAVRGQGKLARWILERVPRILATLAAYFDRPYPYEKLDLVAVPDFGMGAMENAGLVTFRDTLLLLDPARASRDDQLYAQSIVSHELAHQWFGNLVTMAWWDDLWLNEGFATWMATRVLTTIAPELGADLYAVRSAGEVMHNDALAAARAVRQPITGMGDVLNAFDGITYQKGAAILRMLESWAGEAPFRAGIRAYLAAHADGTARTADLFAALEQSTGKPIADVAGTFLDQPGTPEVEVTTSCEGDVATVQLAQRRYRPEGSTAPEGRPWRVPILLRWATSAGTHRQSMLLSDASADVRLEPPGCPLWLHPNADEAGYYRWRVPEPALLEMVGAAPTRLSRAEQTALPGALAALVVAAHLGPDVYLRSLEHLVASDQRQVVEGAIDGFRRIFHAAVDVDGGADAAAFGTLVRDDLRARGDALGLVPRANEDVDAALLRPTVQLARADLGRDGKVRAEARALAARHLAAPRSVPGPAAKVAVPIAALDGDAAFVDRIVALLGHTDDPADRAILLSGLGGLRDPVLVRRALDLYLTDTVRAGEYRQLRSSDTRATAEVGFEWVTAHFDALVQKLGEFGASYLPYSGVAFCDAAGRARVQAFFGEPSHQRLGTPRVLAQVLEMIDECIHLRARAVPAITAFLAARPAATR